MNDTGSARFFSGSYLEARARFVAAASAAGADLSEYPCPDHRGYAGESLTVDVARIGAVTAQDALIIVSAVHGVEGFCGSGCQVGFFADRLYEALPRDTCAILVHALNPFGFSWFRRVNEDGVDLNRNFRDFSAPPPASDAYEDLHESLVPADWEGPVRVRADLALQAYAARHGLRALQAAISGGQYTRPGGLFYGGTGETWSNRVFQRVLEEQVGPGRRRLAVLDLHTGLGPAGYGEPIHIGGHDAAFERARAWYGPEVRAAQGTESVSAAPSGSIFDCLPYARAGEVTAIGLEFGTRPAVEVLTALRADAWLHASPGRATADPELRDRIRAQMREAFHVDTPSWKAAVYGRVADFVLRAARGLAAPV